MNFSAADILGASILIVVDLDANLKLLERLLRMGPFAHKLEAA